MFTTLRRGLSLCLPAASCPSLSLSIRVQNKFSTTRTMPRKSSIPDRWEGYSKVGGVIEGTTIMPIKVPLRESLTSSLPIEERFPPSALLGIFDSSDLKLGGVVDLTYTTKYYDPTFFSKNGVGYRKVFTAGHVIPNDRTFEQFAGAIKTLEKEGQVICVHCTHGLNRSGYMICRYMIEVLSVEPQTAIRLFEQARGHKIERRNYIDDLLNRTPGVMVDFEFVPDDPGNSTSPSSSHQDGSESHPYGKRRTKDGRKRRHRHRKDMQESNECDDSGVVADDHRVQLGPDPHIRRDEAPVPPHRSHMEDDWRRGSSGIGPGPGRNNVVDWSGRGYGNPEAHSHQWNGIAGRWPHHRTHDGSNMDCHNNSVGGRGQSPYDSGSSRGQGQYDLGSGRGQGQYDMGNGRGQGQNDWGSGRDQSRLNAGSWRDHGQYNSIGGKGQSVYGSASVRGQGPFQGGWERSREGRYNRDGTMGSQRNVNLRRDDGRGNVDNSGKGTRGYDQGRDSNMGYNIRR